MDVKIELKKDNSAKALAEFKMAAERALTICAMKAERYAKDDCPVITGRLKNSITNTVTEKEALIGTNVEYAAYVEMGTRRMAAQPYLKPAIEKHVDEYKNIIETELKSGG